MKKKACHTSVRKGKRVSILLRDGKTLIGKFLESKGRFVFLEGSVKIKKSDISNLRLAKH